jgi:hypothetical protein
VVLPAPLRPMMPRPAPWGTSRLTSRSAHIVASTLPDDGWTASVPPLCRRMDP